MSEERKTCQNPIQNAIEAGAKIYCFFEGNSFLDDKALVGTIYKGEESTRSLSFKKKPGERSEMETLANIFGCVGNPAFESGYKQVTGG
ncbi:MAG: hypothetical protein HUJ60_02420, partial [Bacilli bacterium]|nr:hypothetical protein [Bacilli bacterium]